MIRRACVVAVLLVLLAVRPSAADGPSTIADYGRAIDQARALLESAAANPALPHRVEMVRQASALLGSIQQVVTSSGEVLPINNSALVSDLDLTSSAGEAQLSQDRVKNMIARLQALRDAVERPPDARIADRSKLREILENPPFKTQVIANPLQPLWDMITSLINRILGGTLSNALTYRDVLVILALLFVVAVIIYFLRDLRRNWAPEAQVAGSASSETPLNSISAVANAYRHADQGDYRSAIRLLYLATLLWMDERSILRYDRTLTNREYLRAVKDEPAISDTLKPIVETFDRTWYGFEPVELEEFKRYEGLVEKARRLE
jgi:hypothetical protein